MHLLYARFFVKALRDMGLLGCDEPFTRLYHQGMVLGPDGQKMSKSRGNVIAPDRVIEQYGADAVRCYLMFMGPFDQGGPWSNQGIEGVARFLNKLWTLVGDALEMPAHSAEAPDGAVAAVAREVERLRHKMIKRVTSQYAGLQFNTALAALMEFVNGLNRARDEAQLVLASDELRAALETLLILLAPLAPHIAEELWERLGHTASVHLESRTMR
jgi:leucyl-tRNA synthetase